MRRPEAICAELAEDPAARRGRLIAELRDDHDWTFTQICQGAGVKRGSAHRWFRLYTTSDNTRGRDGNHGGGTTRLEHGGGGTDDGG